MVCLLPVLLTPSRGYIKPQHSPNLFCFPSLCAPFSWKVLGCKISSSLRCGPKCTVLLPVCLLTSNFYKEDHASELIRYSSEASAYERWSMALKWLRELANFFWKKLWCELQSLFISTSAYFSLFPLKVPHLPCSTSSEKLDIMR